ncbi:GNAT family N-acetyltransferase [Coprobacter tertius]|uniref:GNAT family N-acetyltransferase n=1 Tax=Coprobacter tertius TaxID=2944915 RepID=A0ABT1MEE5_9BACT|nr:GNAT family N-acetyltransferase [Coprobacter tertius]MCP9610998.1 GNAT family N-acetyltransferase [Coprobacter tertius]
MYRIREITQNKKFYLDFLISADPDEGMIDRYLEQGYMYVLEVDGNVVSEAVILPLSDTACELKNLATKEDYQGRGYATALIGYLMQRYSRKYDYMYVGTSDSGVSFYQRSGFVLDHVVKDFFVKNYSEPIFENGRQCIDMIYLKRNL